MFELLFILGNLSDSSQHQRISRTKSIHSTAIAGIAIKFFLSIKLSKKKTEIKRKVSTVIQTTYIAVAKPQCMQTELAKK